MTRRPLLWSVGALLVTLLLLSVAGPAGAATVDTTTGSADPPVPTTESAPVPTAAVDTGPTATDRAILADSHVQACAADPPADHTDPNGGTDAVVGWAGGYWYNEPVEIDDQGSPTRAEIEALTARTAARVEALRCLPFQEVPPVDVIDREQFSDRIAGDLEEFYTGDREQFLNGQYGAMLIAGQETNAATLYQEHRSGFAAAFYTPSEDTISFVADSPANTDIDEVTLAHELQHALQDQYYNLSRYNRGQTTDTLHANLSVVEGEAQFIGYQYEQNCQEGAWLSPCLRSQAGDSPEPASWQLTLWDLQPYTDGYTLVAQQYEAQGWDGVDALFEDVPTSTLHSIYPDLYGRVEPRELTVPDESSDEWDRLTFDGSDTERVGPAGLAAMFMGVGFETGFEQSIIDRPDILEDHPRDYINFDHPVTDGWRGDSLSVYADGGDTATVWELAWIDSNESQRFADAYADLIEIRGGQAHPDHEGVYTFNGTGDYDMAVALSVRGDQTVIVTAPAVDDLSAVHSSLELGDTTGETDDSETGADDSGPGFDIVLALVGLVGTALLARRWRGTNGS